MPAPALLLLLTAFPAAASSLSIRGRVVDHVRPLGGVTVTLRPAVPEYLAGALAWSGESRPKVAATTETRADGQFDLEAPEAGLWIVRAEHDGLAPMELSLLPLSEPIDLPTLDLAADRRAEVRVLSPEGKPLPGARLLAGPARGFVAHDYFHLAWRAARQVVELDGSGQATLTLPGSPVRIEATAPGHEPAVVEESRADHETIHLPAAAERRLLVRSPDHEPAASVLVWTGDGELPVARTDQLGRVTVPWDTEEPSHELRLLAADGAALRVERFRPSDSRDGSSTPERVTLSKPRALVGRVISLPERTGLGSAWVWLGNGPAEVARIDDHGAYVLLVAPWATGRLRAGAAGFFAEGRDLGEVGEDSRDGPTFALHPSSALTGMVTDPEGRPLADLEVETRFDGRVRSLDELNPPLWKRRSGGVARTRRDGRFRLGNLVPGLDYRLRIEAAGFASYEKVVAAPARDGAPAPDLKLVLAPGTRAAGRVLDPAHQPIAGALVTVGPAQPADDMEMMQRLRDDLEEPSAWTDSTGRFEVRDLPDGLVDLTVEAKGWAKAEVHGITPERHEGIADLGTVVLRPEATIVGRVEDTDGAPVAGAALTIVPNDPVLALAQSDGERGPTEPDALSDGSGRFEIGGLARGERVKLRVDRSGFALLVLPAVAGGGPPVVATLERTRDVVGWVADPEGSPIPGARVQVDTLEAMRVAGAQFMNATRPSGASVQTGEDGRFIVHRVDPGELRLHVTAAGWQARNLGVTVPKAGAEPADELEIVLERAASVTGLVRDTEGEPVVGAEIREVEPDPPPGALSFRAPLATTDGDGRYRLDGETPGRLRLEARHRELGTAVGEIQALPGENHLDFQLEAARSLAGVVVDADELPVDGALVVARSGQVSHSPPAVRTDASGWFRFAGMVPGHFEVGASKPGVGRSAAPTSVDLSSDSVPDLVVELAPEALVTGTIYGLSAEDLAKVRLQAGDLVGVGRVRYDGHYEIDHLTPGDWTIMAELPATGRRAAGRVSIDPADPEAMLDLDFGAGLSLEGLVTLQGRTWPGAAVTVLDTHGIAGWAETDESGKFAVSGLSSGGVVLQVSDATGKIQHREQVELEADATIQIDVTLGSLEGTVVDGISRMPLAGAEVVLSPSAEGGTGMAVRSVTTSTSGTFAVPGLGTGRWRVQVSREGYRTMTEEVDVEAGTQAEVLALTSLPVP